MEHTLQPAGCAEQLPGLDPQHDKQPVLRRHGPASVLCDTGVLTSLPPHFGGTPDTLAHRACRMYRGKQRAVHATSVSMPRCAGAAGRATA